MNIIELAKEAGFASEAFNSVDGTVYWCITNEELEAFAALVRAEREWVDLTDDEKGKVWGDWYVSGLYNEELIDRAIAAFKEKNK